MYWLLSIVYAMTATSVFASGTMGLISLSKTYTSKAGTVRVVAVRDTVPDSQAMVLEFALQEGWKIYHKDSMDAGDAGIPPEFSDNNSQNITISEFDFPPPESFDSLGIKTLGYVDKVSLPFTITTTDVNAPMVFDMDLSFVSCNNYCVPITHNISFTIPPQQTPPINTADTDMIHIPPVFPGESPVDSYTPHIVWILVISLLGGLILNVMPCVLPVLSIKVLQVTDGNRHTMLYTSAGIISVFGVLGAIITLAKTSFGWGFQFQYAWFIVVMNVLLVFMILNLWDKFCVQIPDRLIRILPKGASERGQAFFHGVMTTVLATPCSAPVVGVALGFALMMSPYMAIGVFISMGVGMALPYVILYFSPALSKKLPKPGAWMQTFKKVLSIPLIGLVVYLLYMQVHALIPTAALISMGLIAVIALIQWLKPVYYRMGIVLSMGVLVGLAVLGGKPSIDDKLSPPWVAFDAGAIAPLLQQNKTVVVEVTATWCVTCKVNQFTTYDKQSVQGVITQPNIVMMRADWSLPSDDILQYIQSWNRNGIPLTVVYTPKTPQGVLLPEILTPRVLLSAIQQ